MISSQGEMEVPFSVFIDIVNIVSLTVSLFFVALHISTYVLW